MRFRLLVGKHAQKEPVRDDKGQVQKDAEGNVIRKVVIYKPNDIIETNQDLEAKFNNGPNSRKFERIPEKEFANYAEPSKPHPLGEPKPTQTPAKAPQKPVHQPITPAQQTTLDTMSVKELTDWAAGEEIDLKGATNKEAILKIIKSAS